MWFCNLVVSYDFLTVVPPTIIHLHVVFHYKPSIWGYPHLWNPPMFCHIHPRHAMVSHVCHVDGAVVQSPNATWNHGILAAGFGAAGIQVFIFPLKNEELEKEPPRVSQPQTSYDHITLW